MRGPFFSVVWVSLCALLCTVLVGCAGSAPAPRGEVKGASTSPGELAQSDMNRVATLAMHENLEGLFRLMDKLYRRNLSFECEFGKTIARRDLWASATTEKYRRAAISGVQGIVGGKGHGGYRHLQGLVGPGAGGVLHSPKIHGSPRGALQRPPNAFGGAVRLGPDVAATIQRRSPVF